MLLAWSFGLLKRWWAAVCRGTATVAVVCGLIAAAVLVFAMQRYRQSVNAGGQPETVLVATKRASPRIKSARLAL